MKIKVILIIVSLLFSYKAFAGNPFVTKNKEDFIRIEKYLQNIKYFTANFTQKSPDGLTSVGKLYLSRPGKMRIEYVKPESILVIINGSVLTYQDLELEETSYLRTNSTAASFLTRKNISFSAKDIEVTKFKKNDILTKISLLKKNKKEAGEFTLTFKNNPIKFIKMEVMDGSSQTTIVTLGNHNFSDIIDNKLFFVKNNQLP